MRSSSGEWGQPRKCAMSVLRAFLVLFSILILTAPLMAQAEHHGGEANLVLPDLDQATFLGGFGGRTLLMIGLAVCALGFIFGLTIYARLKNMAVHKSMLEVSELIYETCKTYLLTQGKFLLLLEALIAVIIIFYFGFLQGFEATRVIIILLFSVVGISGSFLVAAFGMRVNTFANSRTAFASLTGKPFPCYNIPLQAGMSIGMLLISIELLIMLFILLYVPGTLAGPCFIGFAIGESLGAAALRVAGGIFTKIADIGSDLMKIVFKIKEDDLHEDCGYRLRPDEDRLQDQGRRRAQSGRHRGLHGRQRGRFGWPIGRRFRDLRCDRRGVDHLHPAGCQGTFGSGAVAGVDLRHAQHDDDRFRRWLLRQCRHR